jgi:hypothetical protein
MKKNIIISALFFLALAIITNPGAEKHRTVCIDTFMEVSQESDPEGGFLADVGFAFILEKYVRARVTSTNYLFFSTTNFILDDGSKKTIGIGAFGLVKIIVDKDKLKN